MAAIFLVATASGPRKAGTATASQLSYREGGGIFPTLLGLVLLAVAAFCLWLFGGLFVPGFYVEPPGGSPWWSWAVMTLLFLANAAGFGYAGVEAVFRRNGVVLDRDTGTVTTWSSLAGKRRAETHPLAGYEAVIAERTGGSFRSGPTYGVFLVGEGQTRRPLGTIRVSRARAEQFAGEVADFLGLPVRG